MSDSADPVAPPAPRTRLRTLAELSDQLSQTKSRLASMRLVGEFLRGLPSAHRPAAARLLLGRTFPEGDPRALAVSAATIWRVACAVCVRGEESGIVWGRVADFGEGVERLFAAAGRTARDPGLDLGEVLEAFDALARQRGAGARKERERILRALLEAAAPAEARFLAKCIHGDMRHGMNEGVLLDATARATGVPLETVRRAHMLLGDIGETVRQAFEGGEPALSTVTPRLFQPIKPMLAQIASSLEEAWESSPGGLALEYKLDGARVQIHREGDEVRLFSRQLHDVTASLPDVTAEVRGRLGTPRAILEGEVVAVDTSGRVRPFQDVLTRYRRLHAVEAAQREVPLRLFLFDLLVEGSTVFLDRPYEERWGRLGQVAGGVALVPRSTPAELAEAERFWRLALDAGHEGVMLKRLAGVYSPGTRGGDWLKLKRAHTLDLVIAAAEWGYGRRHGWLSNFHLAARDADTGEFRPVGKTFKGLTDAEFEAMTGRLLSLKVGEEGGAVQVSPVVVVEVEYSDIQKSPSYPDGMALRFARIVRIRDDKPVAEVDTIQGMRHLLSARREYPEEE